MNWLIHIAESDITRIGRNVERLDELKKTVHDLSFFGIASQSGGHKVLQDLVEHRLVLGRPKILAKLEEALIGENNQKVALDAPTRFQHILNQAEALISQEIGKESRKLRKLKTIANETT